jgi:creatinine amidohydrolase
MKRRDIFLILTTACVVISGSMLIGQGAQGTPATLSQGGYSIFNETMVDLTFQEVEEAAKQNTIVLWPMGVIEEHGPHLPLGTDIYNSYIEFKQVARLLKAAGKSVIIAPPMYWGINEATASFGGSFTVRPSTLKSIIEDGFMSFRKDGFKTVYIINGHNDRLHNQTIVEGVELARATTGVRGFVILNPQVRDRLGLSGSEPHVLMVGQAGPPAAAPQSNAAPVSTAQFIEVHAGAGETSTVWRFFPSLVKTQIIPTLIGTRYGPDDLAEWRKGWENARRKTPLGYFGDPAGANPERGGQAHATSTTRTAQAISQHFETLPWSK